MFSPTIFDADLSEDHNRGKENAALCRGIILDIEHSCIRPHEWPALLPELQMILYSSFGHTGEKPRYRVGIPSTHYVSPFVHEMLGRMIEQRLIQMGYGDQGSPRPHGLDTGKFERTSLFSARRIGQRCSCPPISMAADRRSTRTSGWITVRTKSGWTTSTSRSSSDESQCQRQPSRSIQMAAALCNTA